MARSNPDFPFRFEPSRRTGELLHIGALLIISVSVAVLLGLAISQPPGLFFVLLLVFAFLLSLLSPLLFYRLYSLVKSGYWVSRDGVRLQWGLRQVDLPHEAILDVARGDELETSVMPPRWSWPGAVVGIVRDKELGEVEYLATDKEHLVLLGTKERIYAISPQATKDFVATIKREALRGSLKSINPRSVSPSFVLIEVWSDKWARRLLVAGAVWSLGLLVLVGVLAPGLPTVSLGFGGDGQPLAPVSGVQLFLLPALHVLLYMGSFMLGLLFYREPHGKYFSFLLWASDLFVGFLFLIAILFNL